MKKLVCDICGSGNKVQEGFILPMWDIDMSFNNFDRPYVSQKEIDLCFNCKKRIGNFIREMKYED